MNESSPRPFYSLPRLAAAAAFFAACTTQPIKAPPNPEAGAQSIPKEKPKAPKPQDSAILRLKFDGRPIRKLTKVDPHFWIRNPDGRSSASPEIKRRGDAYVLAGLDPGTYGVRVSVDADPDNPDEFPGDYRAWVNLTVTAEGAPTTDVNLDKLIRLTSPEDNGQTLPKWGTCTDVPELSGPVTIAWDPLGVDAVRYDYRIIKVICEPFAYGDFVAGRTTRETSAKADLPKSAPGEAYLLTIEARANGRRVGSLMTHGGSGFGWDYRFRVVR